VYLELLHFIDSYVFIFFISFLLITLQITRKQAVFMWHYFNGDHDKEEENELNSDASSTFIKGCQSDTDDEPQPNPYPSCQTLEDLQATKSLKINDS